MRTYHVSLTYGLTIEVDDEEGWDEAEYEVEAIERAMSTVDEAVIGPFEGPFAEAYRVG